MANKVQENIDYTVSTFAIERLKPSETAIELCRKNAEGSISLENAIEKIKKKYQVSNN